MTASALVKQSDLKRMATIAKEQGVTVWIEVNGKRVGVSPDNSSQISLDKKPKDFASFADWQTWRDQERVREVQGRS